MPAVFSECDDHNLRRFDGRKSRKPSVIPEFEWDLFFLQVLGFLEANHLGGSGLAGHAHAGNPGPPARPPLAVDHAFQRAGDGRDSGSGPGSTVSPGPACRSRMRGLKIVPPFAIAAYATANCIGVVRLKP